MGPTIGSLVEPEFDFESNGIFWSSFDVFAPVV
jgi:hypothetical protein